MQHSKFQLRYDLIDIESLIISSLSVLIARTITQVSHHPFADIFSILFSFVPLLILSFKLVCLLERKNVFDSNSKAIRLSLFGLFIVPITFVPITMFNYISASYVLCTFVTISASTIFGERISIIKNSAQLLHSVRGELHQDKKNLLIILQVALLTFVSIYLTNQASPISPSEMSYPYLMLLGGAIVISSYLLFSRAKIKDLSIIITTVFLFGFFAIQNIVYYGGDTGFFVSIAKYMINGGNAHLVSPSDRWRFGSTALLGYPSLVAYLSESSGVSPEIGIAFANSIGIVFAIIGGYTLANFLGRNTFEKSLILFVYVLLQASIYNFDISTLRSASMLFLALPLIVPLFTQLRFNKFGKIAFIIGMFSLIIIHPLSFIIAVIMMAFLFKNLIMKERLVFLGLIAIFCILVVMSPALIRSLSISQEELPKFTIKTTMFNQLLQPFPDFTTSSWPDIFTYKISFIFTYAILLIAFFAKKDIIPRVPLIACIILFFFTSSIFETSNFPISRLSMFFGSIGIVTTAIIIARCLQNLKISLSLRTKQIIQVSLLSIILMSIIINSYPKDRALRLDTLNTKEYLLLNKFVSQEKTNFDESIILAHIETLRYLNGLDGSILYYNNAPTAFLVDFTDRSTATKQFDAFANALSGHFSMAKRLALQHNVTSAYIIILYRLVPAARTFSYGEPILHNEAGMIRKISFTIPVKT